MGDPSPLPTREAYALWAATYGAENAVTHLEHRAVRTLTPDLAGLRLLDAACGTGRRLPRPGAGGPACAIGIDLVPEMLARARRPRIANGNPAARTAATGTPVAAPPAVAPLLAAADLRALPFADDRFDVVWCRLALGHLAELGPAYTELARVACHGAHVIVTDFHPAAARAGHVRSFRDRDGLLHVVEHHIHDPDVHAAAARDAGLTLIDRIEPEVGPAVRHFYQAAGRLAAYHEQRALPLVLALAFRA